MSDRTVELNGNSLDLDMLHRILTESLSVRVAPHAAALVQQSRETLEHILHSGKVVYGVNTGFGKFSDVRISDENIQQLQTNLVRSHAAGTGEPFPLEIVRTLLILKINGLCKGFSAVRMDVLDLLTGMFNHAILPIIPQKGSVGSSGDLAPLAHLALCMIGEGECWHQGRRMSAAHALHAAGLKPLQLMFKEGLAILNGTQAMTSVGAIALLRAMNVLECADIFGAMSAEVLLCTDAAFDERIHLARNQEGQIVSAENLRTLLHRSPMVASHVACTKVQDAYSVRCMPQVHGASRDAVTHVRRVVEREMNAASDNPLIFTDKGDVLSGGNFHGQPVALTMDYLATAMSEIGNIAERRIAWMMDPHLNEGLPAFLAKDGGLNSGYMIAQYTAAALASENKSLCHPASVDSIPTSANQEDHVSMGTIAARKCLQVIENVETILAIEFLCAAQAADFRKPLELAHLTGTAYRLLRQEVASLDHDRITHTDIEKAVAIVRSRRVVDDVWGS